MEVRSHLWASSAPFWNHLIEFPLCSAACSHSLLAALFHFHYCFRHLKFRTTSRSFFICWLHRADSPPMGSQPSADSRCLRFYSPAVPKFPKHLDTSFSKNSNLELWFKPLHWSSWGNCCWVRWSYHGVPRSCPETLGEWSLWESNHQPTAAPSVCSGNAYIMINHGSKRVHLVLCFQFSSPNLHICRRPARRGSLLDNQRFSSATGSSVFLSLTYNV